MIPLGLKIGIASWITVGLAFFLGTVVWKSGEFKVKDIGPMLACLLIGPIMVVIFIMDEHGETVIGKRSQKSPKL